MIEMSVEDYQRVMLLVRHHCTGPTFTGICNYTPHLVVQLQQPLTGQKVLNGDVVVSEELNKLGPVIFEGCVQHVVKLF